MDSSITSSGSTSEGDTIVARNSSTRSVSNLFDDQTSPLNDPLLPSNHGERDDDDANVTENEFDVAGIWSRFVSKNHTYILLLTFAILLPAGLYSFPQFIGSTDSTMHPIPGSKSEKAIQIFRESFGPVDGIGLRQDDPMNDGIVLLLTLANATNSDDDDSNTSTLIDGSSELFFATRNFSIYMQDYLVKNLPIPSEEECYQYHIETFIQPSVNVTSYYSLQDERLTKSALRFATGDGRSTILHVAYSIPSCLYTGETSMKHNLQLNYGKQILESVQSYGRVNIPQNVTMGSAGMLSFRQDMSKSLAKDMQRMHLFVLPLALFLFSLALGGHALLVTIPIVCVVSVVCAWSTVMNVLVHCGLQVTQFTPNVMISLTFGIGIDYSLFLLSRVLSELKYSHSLIGEELVTDEDLRHAAITSMMQHAGHTIIASGVTLMSTFLGLYIFPIY